MLRRWNERTRGRRDTRRTYTVFQVIQPVLEDHEPEGDHTDDPAHDPEG